jgi:hypothetical protein
LDVLIGKGVLMLGGITNWNINYSIVLRDLRDEAAGVEVIGHGHPEAQDEYVAAKVGLQKSLGEGLCVAVERAGEVGRVGFLEAGVGGSVHGVFGIVLVDACDGWS